MGVVGFARFRWRLDMAEKLATLGADPTIRSEFGVTPGDIAEAAQKSGHTNVSKLLLDAEQSSSEAK